MGRVCARITSIFSFPTHTRAYFAHELQKDYKTFSMWLQNKDKTETQNALCNFAKSPHMCRLLIVWLGALYGLCILPYIYGLRSALVDEYGLSGCFMRSWLVWALSAWERERVWGFVFISVDVNLFVNVFIYYNCMGRLRSCVWRVYSCLWCDVSFIGWLVEYGSDKMRIKFIC